MSIKIAYRTKHNEYKIAYAVQRMVDPTDSKSLVWYAILTNIPERNNKDAYRGQRMVDPTDSQSFIGHGYIDKYNEILHINLIAKVLRWVVRGKREMQ